MGTFIYFLPFMISDTETFNIYIYDISTNAF